MRFLLLLCLLIAAIPARAQTRLDDILSKGVLRVGLTGDYKPFSYVDPATAQYSGMDVDRANALAKTLGVKLEIVPTKWANLMPDLLADKFDMAMGGITITLERQKKALFSAPVMRAGKTAIARCADQDKFASLTAIDRPGVRVIANPGGTNESFDRANLHSADIVMFPDNSRIFEEVIAGHADVMITDGVETRLQQKLHPELCAIHPDQPFNVSELAYMLPRDLIWQQYVNQWIGIDRLTGVWQREEDAWLK